MTKQTELPWTGERFLPELGGDIALEHFHRYAFARSLASNKRVLDVACGEGYGARMLAEVASEVVGVDINPTVIAHASATYNRSNLQFCVGSCTRVDLPDASIDLVISFETLEHHAEHDAMLAELRRVLTPDGMLVISTPDRLHYSDDLSYSNPFHVRELYSEEFVALIQRHFEYSLYLGQKITYGSIIAPIRVANGFSSYFQTENDVCVQPGVRSPLYILAVASAMPVEAVGASLFDQTKTHIAEHNQLHQDLKVAQNLLASIYSSTYWRVAAPVRWLRKAVRRMRNS